MESDPNSTEMESDPNSTFGTLTHGLSSLPNTSAHSFDLAGRVAVVTGGYGVIGGMIASGLAASGVRVAILGRRQDSAQAKADEICRGGGDAIALVADVLDDSSFATPAARSRACGETSTFW